MVYEDVSPAAVADIVQPGVHVLSLSAAEYGMLEKGHRTTARNTSKQTSMMDIGVVLSFP